MVNPLNDHLSGQSLHHFLFISVLTLAFFLRVNSLEKFETWSDEKLSVSEANSLINYDFGEHAVFTKAELEKHNSIENVVSANIEGDGGNGIFYTILLHYWSALFGNTDFAVRFLSVISGILTCVAGYFISMELFNNRKNSVLSMLLFSIHPFLITYSQEARAYSLAVLLSLIASLLFFKMIKKNTFNATLTALYFLSCILSFLTHFSTIYIFLTHAILLVFIYKTDFEKWIRITPYAIISIAIILLWMFSFGSKGLEIIAERNRTYSALSMHDPENSFYMKTGVYSILAGCFQNLLFFCGNTFINLGFRILHLIPLLAIPFYIILNGLLNRKTKKYSFVLLVLFILTMASMIYASTLSLISGHIISFQQLYSIFSIPYFLLILGFSMIHALDGYFSKYSVLLTKTTILLQIVIMVICTRLIYLGFDSNTKNSNRYQQASLRLTENYHSRHSDLEIVYSNKETAIEMNKYLSGDFKFTKQVIDSNSSAELSLYFPDRKQYEVIFE